MRVSSQVRYAICGVFDLAYNGQGEPVQVRVIGERQRVPVRYLEQIFQRLRRAGLVAARRGPGGGYRLARAASEITLRDVVEAVEGPIASERVGAGARARRAAGMPSPYEPAFLWAPLSSRLGDALAEVTLETLCRDAARAAVRRADEDARMYFI
jgi:Rrf2 family iron-sulfur cluster assembly transcriptional regulator